MGKHKRKNNIAISNILIILFYLFIKYPTFFKVEVLWENPNLNLLTAPMGIHEKKFRDMFNSIKRVIAIFIYLFMLSGMSNVNIKLMDHERHKPRIL